ncbi:MAG: YceK/YidQ family lipoprotein, partial [Proteobacteria bacterium]|nr:YceK/YidQ family lipoprotein [Pseudomonadota bacterium]
AFAHGGFIDLPFSFVFDTILLPYTIPRTIWNYATGRRGADDRRDEDDEEEEEIGPEETVPGGAGNGGVS